MESETAQMLLQEVYMLTNPNRSLNVLVTLELFQKFPMLSCSSFPLEHSTNAAKKGSFRKLSLVWYFFWVVGKISFWLNFLADGGNGRKFNEGFSIFLFLGICLFFGIPGIFSQEKGIRPENLRVVVGLEHELLSDEFDDEKDGDEERESVRRDDGRIRGENRVSVSSCEIWPRSLKCAILVEGMTFVF